MPNKVAQRLKQLRKARSHSLRELAERAQCSASFLSQIELGHTSPSVESLERICSALNISLADFFQKPAATSGVVVQRAGRSRDHVAQWPGGKLSYLLPSEVPVDFSALLLHLKPGRSSHRRAALRRIRELGVVLQGEVTFELDTESHLLGPGDSVYFELSEPHRWLNHGAGPAAILLVNPNFTEVARLPRLPRHRPAPHPKNGRNPSVRGVL
jgi:quercetin dioxygenase-like cupin family protein/DNA-binding Xre family transcriptional regulator